MDDVKSFKLVSSVLIDRILKDQCVSAAQLDQLSKVSSADSMHFVCSALPGPGNECVFVELETPDGNGSGLGEWVTRPDGLVALVVPVNRDFDAQRLRADTAEVELAKFEGEIVAALPGVRFMDSPDGGSPTLGEQVSRMAEALAADEQRIADYEFALMYVRSQIDYSPLVAYIDAALNPKPEAGSHE